VTPPGLRTVAEFLEALIAQSDTLLNSLTREYEALAVGDAETIATAAADKDRLGRTLEELQRELARLLDGRSLRRAIAEAPESERTELELRHTLLKTQLTECRHRNAVNGKVVHRSRQSVAELIRILSGSDANAIYTASGRKRSGQDGQPLALA
jgi:flagellar biosynthesis/type III secretory pathway chaperone